MVSEALLRPSSHMPKARALGCRPRDHPIIVLTDRFSLARDQETLAYASLLKSGSWRSDEILSGCPSYVDALSYHGLQPLEIDELTRLNRTLLDHMLASTRCTTRDIARTVSCMSTDLRPISIHSSRVQIVGVNQELQISWLPWTRWILRSQTTSVSTSLLKVRSSGRLSVPISRPRR